MSPPVAVHIPAVRGIDPRRPTQPSPRQRSAAAAAPQSTIVIWDLDEFYDSGQSLRVVLQASCGIEH